MKYPAAVPAAALLLALNCQASNCDAIQAQIAAKFQARGIPSPNLMVVEAGPQRNGRVVGTCGHGTRQIVYLPRLANAGPTTTAAAGTAAPNPAITASATATVRPTDKIPTECKDGSVVIGPNCDDPRAVRMTPAEIDASASAPTKLASGALAASATPAAPAAKAASAAPAAQAASAASAASAAG